MSPVDWLTWARNHGGPFIHSTRVGEPAFWLLANRLRVLVEYELAPDGTLGDQFFRVTNPVGELRVYK